MIFLVAYVLTFVFLVSASWWAYFTSTRFWKLCRRIPGPTPLPVIGNIHNVWGKLESIVPNFVSLVKNHYPMCRLFIGSKCFVVLQDPDHIHSVLHSSKALSKFSLYNCIDCVIGQSIITMPREQWSKHRQIMTPAFKTKIIRSFLDVFNEKSKQMCDRLKEKADGKPFDIFEATFMATVDTIAEAMYGFDMRVQRDDKSYFVALQKEGMKLIQKLGLSPWGWSEFMYKHSHFLGKFKKYLKDVFEFHAPVLTKLNFYKQKEIQNDLNDYSGEHGRLGFIDYMLKFMLKNKETIVGKEIESHFLLLRQAGSDTTAFTVSVCFMLLGIHTEVQDKVVSELRGIFGDDVRRPVEHEDFDKMVYTEQVIKETLRLFSVAFFTGRRICEDMEIDGYVFPAGTEVIISPYLLHRNPKYFQDPIKFDPDRFAPDRIPNLHPHCFIPFLDGPRNCIGQYYAMLQMKILVSRVLLQFRFLPHGSVQEIQDSLDMSMLLVLKNGYNVRMEVR